MGSLERVERVHSVILAPALTTTERDRRPPQQQEKPEVPKDVLELHEEETPDEPLVEPAPTLLEYEGLDLSA